MLQRVVTCRLSRILPATVRLPEPLGSSHAIDANLFKFQTEALPKFGVFVTIASQRPNDISPTITSQAHNYFIHRLLNEWDLKAIASAELEKIEWAIPLFPIKGIYGEANQSRIRAFTLVLRWTGLRIRDVVRLQPNAVRNSYVVLRAQKNGKLVKILVPQIVTDELRKIENGSEYYFWSGLGNPKSCVGDWQRTLRRLSEISGVHIHAHRWRHTFATDLLSKGVPVSEVAALLGNSIRIVEKHYNQFIQARQDALDEAVKKTWV